MRPLRENSNKLLAIIISRPLIETEENFNTKPISIWAKLCSLLFVFCFSSAVLAEDCFRGILDKQYCDRDHDLVADLPLRWGVSYCCNCFSMD